MWSWLKDNHASLTVVFQFLTLIVWALYFQLLLMSLRHRSRPRSS